MSTTLPLFWQLSSSSKADRIEASVKLVGALEQFQFKFTPFLPPESSSDDEEAQVDTDRDGGNDGLDGPNAPDVSYSIRRLIRGLASPRESSRLGFAVALTELLSHLNTVSAAQILSLITQASQIHGSMKGQEERDMLFARLFGVTSLTQSGLLFRSTPLATSSNHPCTLKDFQDAMAMLLALPTKKSFLKEPSYWTLILAIRALAASEVEWKADAWTWVTQIVFIEDRSWFPEKVGVALSMQNLEIEANWQTLAAPTFRNGDILSSGNLGNLAKILKNAEIEDPDTGSVKSKSSAIWKPQLHFIWNLILDVYFPPPGTIPSKIKSKASFLEFFRVAVDDSLLASTSSDGRKLWGFELFRLALTRVPASELPRIFLPNFMRSWVNHLSKPDRYLHKAAKLVASSLPPIISANPSAGFPVLLQLLQTHGHFDRLTRTKTVESLLAAMDVGGVEEYVMHLCELARKPNAKSTDAGEEDPTATRIWVTDQFATLIRNGAIPKTDTWIHNVLGCLLLYGLFGTRKKNEKSKNRWLHDLPEPAFSDEARAACRTRLLFCLTELTTQITLLKTGDEKTVRNTGVASDGELWVSKVLLDIVALEKDTKHVLRLGPDEQEVEEDGALRDRTLRLLGRLKTVKLDLKEAVEGAEVLLVATLLYRYLSDDRKDDDDVETCLDSISRLFSASTTSPDKNKKKKTRLLDPSAEDIVPNEDDVTPIGAVVDTLIGYLEKSTAYHRAIANHVFGLLTGLVDRSTVELILAQLERRDPTHEEEEEEEEEEEHMLDSENIDIQSNEDSSDSESRGEDSEENVEDDPDLRRKIEEAIRASGILAATDESDEDTGSDSSNEEVLDDDQMMKLDEHLAEIFRSRAKEKGRGDSGAQREATHFKNRVLDLVDIFLRKEPTNQYAPKFMLPLVKVIMGTGPDERQLSDKVTALLRNRFGKAKDVPTIVDLGQTQKTLEELHDMARKAHTPDIRETISTCSLYLTRVLLSESSDNEQMVVGIYRATLADFATRKASPLQSSFIQDFVKRQPRFAWQLREDFVQFAEKAVNVYRKCQTFQLLHPLLTQMANFNCSTSDMIIFVRKFRQAVCNTISSACDDAESLNTLQVKELLKLSILAVRQTKRVADIGDLAAVWGSEDWVLLLKKVEASRFKTATSLHSLFRQLLATLGSSKALMDGGRDQAQDSNQKKRKAENTKDLDVKQARQKKSKKAKE
ncbi:hypothetical protein K439DRAFT_1393490 [Ramaria rubella]|nr:hypothetical protein K439DRAFT_1393490 [Ramaria rubella]